MCLFNILIWGIKKKLNCIFDLKYYFIAQGFNIQSVF